LKSHPRFDLGLVDDSVGNRSTDPSRWRKSVRGRFAAYFSAIPGRCRRDIERRTDFQALFRVPEGSSERFTDGVCLFVRTTSEAVANGR
jgi:hypothetical protein